MDCSYAFCAYEINIEINLVNIKMPILQCVKEKNKLRVKIISPGYLNTSNCQFPRDLRVEGRMYECPENCISLAKIGSKFFYKISKSGITISNETDIQQKMPDKIFTDDNPDCAICFSEPKELIFIPCGHFSICGCCDKQLTKRVCPICRSTIISTIKPEQMQ